MYSEIGFIFSPALDSYNNNDNTGNIYQRPIRIQPSTPNTNTSQGQTTPTNGGGGTQNPAGPNDPNRTPSSEDGVLVYKNPNQYVGTTGIINYLKKVTYNNDDSNEDPYITLIRYFNKPVTKALTLRAADFAYLKDLGVYPINRLWILRRFPDNCIVPNNLLSWGKAVEPISTVVGWIKDAENTPLVSLSFNEVWTDQNEMIDKVLSQILKDNFNFSLPMTIPVPGWSQGLLFGMLNAMGLTDDYNAMNVPTGDPNVLRVAKMRDASGAQGLQSRMSLTLETSYEQKYINGVDPGLAMLDVLSNLFKMGTSDQRFILSNSLLLQQLIGNINGNKNVNAWMDFIKALIGSFVKGTTDFITKMSSENASNVTAIQTTNLDRQQSTGTPTPEASSANNAGSGGLVKNVANSLLAGTIAKYRWPLKGSIALMSGINTTPWHLTMGNPYSPIINIGNIVIGNVEVKLSNDLGFNDMPARIDVGITAEFGRPLGKQELEKMFNNGYKRVYSKGDPSNTTDSNPATSNVTASGERASSNVLANQTQPVGTISKINKSVNPQGG